MMELLLLVITRAIIMNNLKSIPSRADLDFSINAFDLTGKVSDGILAPLSMARIITTDGKQLWQLVHHN